MIVLMYLGAVVAANLVVAHFGTTAVLPVSFFLVGFVMVGRDRLHDAWHGGNLGWKMTALVCAGGLLSFLLNADALRIAVASSVAFAASETVNALVYAPMLRRRWPWLARVNVGNVPNALTDSALFIGLAFGWMPGLILLQAGVKVGGGALWSVLLRYRKLATVLPLLCFPIGVDGQIVTAGAGVVSTEHGGSPALDLFVALPPMAGLRVSGVGTYDGDLGAITKVSRTLLRNGPSFVNVDAGATWLAFREHRPEPFVGIYAGAPLPVPRTALHAAVTTDPWDGWGWAVLVKVDVLLWFRR